jgi:hypothetical protein
MSSRSTPEHGGTELSYFICSSSAERKPANMRQRQSGIFTTMDELSETHLRGSGRTVDDFASFCEGDIEPRLHKKIGVLIDSTANYIVYLDEDFYVEWAYSRLPAQSPPGFDTVANQIGHLETLSITQLTKIQREPFARLLGEAMARVIGGGTEEEARAVLERAGAYLTARGTENARLWYLKGAGQLAALSLAIAVGLLAIRNHVGNPQLSDAMSILAGAMMGGIGAFLSISARTESIRLDPVAGERIHRIEGMVRVTVGLLGALFLALAIKANLVLGLSQTWPHPLLALLIFCIVAGASERLVPGLIKNMESSLSREKKDFDGARRTEDILDRK